MLEAVEGLGLVKHAGDTLPDLKIREDQRGEKGAIVVANLNELQRGMLFSDKWTQREIGEALGVHHRSIGRLRETAPAPEIAQTANLGAGQPEPAPVPEPKPPTLIGEALGIDQSVISRIKRRSASEIAQNANLDADQAGPVPPERKPAAFCAKRRERRFSFSVTPLSVGLQNRALCNILFVRRLTMTQKKTVEERVQEGLEKVPLQYINGFVNVLGNNDIVTVLELHGRPVQTLVMSHSLAKTLGEALTQVVAQYENITNSTVLKTQETEALFSKVQK